MRAYAALLLLLLRAAAQDSNTEGNRIWPDEPSLDAETVRKLASDVCARSLPREPEVLSAREAYPANNFGGAPGGENSALHWITSSRGILPLKQVVDECGSDATYGDGEACNEAWQHYITDMIWPFGVPFLLGILSSLTHCTCCFVACCRCCRRKFICCQERQEPREAPRWMLIAAVVVWAGASLGIFVLGATMNEVSITLHETVDWHLCTALNLASEATGGSPGMYLGSEVIASDLDNVASALDVDGAVMSTVRRVIEETSTFHQLHENFELRANHLLNVLNLTGPGHRALEHRCVFCSIAVGDASNPTSGFPGEGLLLALKRTVSASALEAMHDIRILTNARLTGDNLTELARDVKRANAAAEKFHLAMHDALVRYWPRLVNSADMIEPTRLVVFISLGWCAMAGAVIGWLAWIITRVRVVRNPDVPPSPKPHCCAWCCGFCYTATALMLGGLLLAGSMFAGEGCIFLHEELLLWGGPTRYAPAFGLLPGEDDMAVNMVETCFTANGTGDLVTTLGIAEQMAFQPDLSRGFYNLDGRWGESPEGAGTTELLQQLRITAAEHGNLFVLDPLPAVDSSTLGILELNPNVADLLLGSTLFPDDSEAPGSFAPLIGLNKYAELIAGPGEFTFSRGTAGGGFVITPDEPTELYLESVPLGVRNALLYARVKERLLATNDSIRCDTLDAQGVVTERRCSVRAFHAFVIDEARQLEEAVNVLASEAANVMSLFRTDMKIALNPLLRGMRDLQAQLGCRFLWRRLEEFDDGLCNGMAPMAARGAMQMLGLAAITYIGIIVQYKVWRHMKDNKILKYELERYEKKYNEAQQRMAREKARQAQGEEAMYQYAKDLEQEQLNEQGGKFTKSGGSKRHLGDNHEFELD